VNAREFFNFGIRMANRTSITVPLSEDLREALNDLAKAQNRSAAEIVREMLTNKLSKLLPLAKNLRETEAKIRAVYDDENENGQGTVRRSSSPDASKGSAKNRRNKQA
jgi:predicted DNA-binding protein